MTEEPFETNHLLASDTSADDEDKDEDGQVRALYMVLPVAFLCSMGMAATAATTISAYANLLCENPLHCAGDEKNHYAGVVALSVTISNFCGILVLGLLRLLPKRNPKAALYFWLFSRSASVAILAIGVYRHNVWIAISGRIFEGFATDNILQLALNSIYVQAPRSPQVSRLFGMSLGLYMLGQALSPSIAGIFKNFRASFALAIVIFVLCIIYLLAFVSLKEPEHVIPDEICEEDEMPASSDNSETKLVSRAFLGLVDSLAYPLKALVTERVLWGAGLALFFFLAAISYIYPALMVFAAIRFNFTGRENGWLLSTAATSSSIYLFSSIFITAKVKSRKREYEVPFSPQRLAFGPNYWLSMASMALICLIMPFVAFSVQSWHLFLVVAVASMGLSAPSFLKSYAVSLVTDGTQALTGLALMETVGALLSPMILGVMQSKFREDLVFTITSAIVAMAMLLLTTGAVSYASPIRAGTIISWSGMST